MTELNTPDSVPAIACPAEEPRFNIPVRGAEPRTAPEEPQSIAEAGLAESLIESLVLKALYFRGELYGRDLSMAVGLKFSAIQDVVESLKLRHHVQVKRSLGVGNVGALLVLTDAGRSRARESLEANQYAGVAPVPLEQYIAVVREQRPRQGWLTRAALAKAFSGMVITEQLLSQIGPAISSANSLLLYGKPGDGKTYLIESLNNLDTAPVFVPYAIECQGNIIQVFDPVYHTRMEEDSSSPGAIVCETPYDRRWIKCRRPFIVSGGELTLDMLDLRFNQTSKVYEAPFQLKANNGIYLIDDFGRQRATPAEVLNRWIVPMERRLDYLSFLTGGKMTVPFETFLVFSTNLKPADLGDEAFLRRIHYKMLLRGPARNEFLRIFENFCAANNIPYQFSVINNFIERRYERPQKSFRRCHPRDMLTHALNLMHFENLPRELTEDILERAFESCFVQDEEDVTPREATLLRQETPPCFDYWKARARDIPTSFGTLAFLAGFRNRITGTYHDARAERDYSAAEISETALDIHTKLFRAWLNLNLEEKCRDLGDYLSTPEGRATFLSFDRRELIEILTPTDAGEGERNLFQSDLAAVLILLSQQPAADATPSPMPEEGSLVERIA
jgi:hypothetical protein